MLTEAEKISNNPCFSLEPTSPHGVLRLPVAPGCNMRCRFCLRRAAIHGAGDAGPFGAVLTPEGAVDKVAHRVEANHPPDRVEFAGPGEPLANAATFVVLRKLNWLYPDLALSVWTNGLLLPDRLGELAGAGVRSVTVAIHAAEPETAVRIYEWIIYRGRRSSGREAAEFLLYQQWSGLADVVEAGLEPVVSSVVIPGVNEKEMSLIAERALKLGVENVRSIPLAPQPAIP